MTGQVVTASLFVLFFLSLPALTFSLKARSDLSLTSLDSAGGPAAKFISGSECEGGQRINAAQRGSARPVAKSSTRAHRSHRYSRTNAKQGHEHARKISDQ